MVPFSVSELIVMNEPVALTADQKVVFRRLSPGGDRTDLPTIGGTAWLGYDSLGVIHMLNSDGEATKGFPPHVGDLLFRLNVAKLTELRQAYHQEFDKNDSVPLAAALEALGVEKQNLDGSIELALRAHDHGRLELVQSSDGERVFLFELGRWAAGPSPVAPLPLPHYFLNVAAQRGVLKRDREGVLRVPRDRFRYVLRICAAHPVPSHKKATLKGLKAEIFKCVNDQPWMTSVQIAGRVGRTPDRIRNAISSAELWPLIINVPGRGYRLRKPVS
ncbi:MAG: hypothetical protein HZB26_08845 [Candidatus Hydrogenedentes bacterium]|nr:hypothetical protein [Candidatus Hydrogenedentota bacterium]